MLAVSFFVWPVLDCRAVSKESHEKRFLCTYCIDKRERNHKGRSADSGNVDRHPAQGKSADAAVITEFSDSQLTCLVREGKTQNERSSQNVGNEIQRPNVVSLLWPLLEAQRAGVDGDDLDDTGDTAEKHSLPGREADLLDNLRAHVSVRARRN